MSVDPKALAASNRLLHQDYPDTNTPGQTLDAMIADGALVAAAYQALVAGAKP